MTDAAAQPEAGAEDQDTIPLHTARREVARSVAEKTPGPQAIRDAVGVRYAEEKLPGKLGVVRTPPHLAREAEVKKRLREQDRHDHRRAREIEMMELEEELRIKKEEAAAKEREKVERLVMAVQRTAPVEMPPRSNEVLAESEAVRIQRAREAHEMRLRKIEEARAAALAEAGDDESRQDTVNQAFDVQIMESEGKRQQALAAEGIHPEDVPFRLKVTAQAEASAEADGKK
ncbi:MAG: hypothetical protein ACYS22_17665 [Planctomycetota bacterium]